MKKIYIFLVSLCLSTLAYSQNQYGEIRGTVIDKENKKPLEDAAVTLFLNDVVKGSTYTNEKGSFSFKTLDPGEYDIKMVLTGYKKLLLENVQVESGSIAFPVIEAESTLIEKEGITKKAYKNPLISKGGVNGKIISSKDLTNIPTRNINSIVGQSANVNSINGGTPTFSGARASGTVYYIDGVRVLGGATIPRSAIDQIQVIVGGTPAMYGDFTGGVINITTKGPSRQIQGGLEAISSSMFDKYHFNQFEFSVQGPIKNIHKKSAGERTLLGYAVSGNLLYAKDPSPSAIGYNYLNDSTQAALEKHPLRPAPIGFGYVSSGEYVTNKNIDHYSARRNVPLYSSSFNGSLVYQPTKTITLTFGGNGSYQDNIGNGYDNSLFNYANGSHSVGATGRVYARFTHVLKKDEKKKTDSKEVKSIVSSAFYTIRADYTYNYSLTEDVVHKKNIFNYGYIGKFTTYRAATFEAKGIDPFGKIDPFPAKRPFHTKSQATGNDTTMYLSVYFVQTPYQDSAVKFSGSDMNKVRTQYTQDVFDYTSQKSKGFNTISSIDQLRGLGGLANGDAPQQIYQIWNNVGAPASGYGKSRSEQFSVFAMSEVTLRSKKDPDKKHDIQFGLSYEQRFSRAYSVSTFGIWSLMRQLSDQSKPILDTLHPIVSQDLNGVFQGTVKYNLINNDAKSSDPNNPGFIVNLRNHLIENNMKDANGRPIDRNSFIDIDMYGPEHYNLKYFTPDELLNNGSSIVSYFGYDAYGNALRGKQKTDAFFNDPSKRSIGAFQPIYTAAFIQDQFAFKDLVFRVGVRVDRYDANQLQLKDPYSLYPVKTVREVRDNTTHPDPLKSQLNSQMADDNIVYVNDVENPTSIVGYRQSNYDNNVTHWYDKNGNIVSDPTLLAVQTSNGQIAPYLLTQSATQKLTGNSFVSYTPKLYVLPRIWFNFPISSDAQFFANYDVLTQRPADVTGSTNINRLDDYYFLSQRVNTAIFQNPSLRPQRTTAYELGFKQKLGENSALSLIATYREMRDMIALYKYNGAYPISYTTFGNLDFGTVKGFRVEYELRDAGGKRENLNFSANYSLLFADGTGSNAGSQQALISSGQPNLRTVFPLDYDVRHTIKGNFDFHYKENDGPIINKKYLLENSGFNFIFQIFSGLPYTAKSQPVNEAQNGIVQRSQIRGNVNGSRRPWQFNTDLTFDKTFYLNKDRKAQKEGKKPKTINVYFWLSNLFNIKNITNVYQYSGSASNDGYLNSLVGQQAAARQTSSQSFIDLYTLNVNSPGNYYLPRQIRLGMRYYF